MRLDVILRVITKLLLPFMVMFAFYVHFHGEFSPGGGFQAGVIIAAAVVFHALMFGLYPTQRMLPPWVVEMLVPLGVFIYVVVGIVTMMLGENFLGYNPLHPTKPYYGQERGIIWIEVGVLVTVASTMVAIFYAFAGRGRKP
ncbi:MAG: Na(+)/H(+) antiporter subunit B [Pseudomonadota bacterium]